MSTALSTNVRPQDLIFRGGAETSSMPAHIVEDKESAVEGTENLARYIRPPRVKVCQSNRTGTLKSFPEGSVILTPANILVAKNDEPFYFVPILFFPEYLTLNPWSLKASLPYVRARTLDDMSDIAKKARDKDLRKADVCPESKDGKDMLTHVESLTFLCVIIGQPLMVAMSFQRGEWKTGSQLASQIAMRGAPIYSQVYQGKVSKEQRHNDQGDWYGIDISAPSGDNAPSPWVQSPEEFAKLRDMHRKHKKDLQDQLIQIDHDYDDDTESAAPNESAASI